MAFDNSVTWSMFILNIVFKRMSRIMTVGSFIPSSDRGAGGAMTFEVSIFISSYPCLIKI